MTSALVWFRRDLRDYDHAALYHALKQHRSVYCAFVFDTAILASLTNKQDRRVEFIWESVLALKTALQAHGGDLLIRHGRAIDEIAQLARQLKVDAVYSNRDYEPVAVSRDHAVKTHLAKIGIVFSQFKDQVLFEQDEILTQTGKPYGVFTPYKKAHLAKLNDFYVQAYPVDAYLGRLAKVPAEPCPSLESLGFKHTQLQTLKVPTGMKGGLSLFEDFVDRMPQYQQARNYPAVKGVSYLSVHLRFGTVSIRHLARTALMQVNLSQCDSGAQCWLNELIWRDFYFQILHHRPDLQQGHTYQTQYDDLIFTDDTGLFEAWCQGQTGYPIVDAGMRQLNQTGYMHNRLRMIVASFLVKDLLIDWRWGERYFAEKLIDFDFSANNGGWQWAASVGCDAQPYFRIFNPTTQSERFDPQGKFIRKYIPELAELSDKYIHAPYASTQTITLAYPMPIVNHAEQRLKALALFKQAATSKH